MENNTTYHTITQKITTILKTGIVPWAQSWTGPAPRNFATGKPYRGVNALLLRAAARTSPFWLTKHQLEEHASQPIKGQRPALATFWRRNDGQDKSLLLFYPLWNLDQLQNAPVSPPLPGPTVRSLEAADALIKAMPAKPNTTRTGDTAYYDPAEDRINMPRTQKFSDLNHYYSTWFHELIHSTRHASRLNRIYRQQTEAPLNCGQCDYSREELVAELGAALLCAETGIVHHCITQAAGWLQALEADEKLLVHAAAAAQRAADFLTGQVAVPAQSTTNAGVTTP